MNICEEFKNRLIDYVENHLSEQEYKRYYEHLRCCRQCQKEYGEVKKLYKILDTDEVVLPEEAFFDDLRSRVRREKMRFRSSFLQKLMRIFVPIFAAAIILLILSRPETTVEIAVPTSALIADREIASLSLSGVIDEELIEQMSIVDNYLSFEMDETIDELTSEEQAVLVEQLYEKYGNGD